MVALFVLATIVTCVVIEFFLQRSKRRAEVTVREPVRPKVASRFLVPRSFFLSPGHSWVELLFTGNVKIGIDDFVQKLVGPVDEVVPASVGDEISKGKPLFSIRQGNRTLSIPSPVSGRIMEINSGLKSSPAALNADPYITGWVAVIEPTNLASELKSLSLADEAAQWLKREIARFRDFIKEQIALTFPDGNVAVAGTTLLDGGMPIAGVLKYTDEQTWKAFEQNFLGAGERSSSVN